MYEMSRHFANVAGCYPLLLQNFQAKTTASHYTQDAIFYCSLSYDRYFWTLTEVARNSHVHHIIKEIKKCSLLCSSLVFEIKFKIK